MKMIETDTVVLGGGPGGYAAAIRLGQLGIKTVLVEESKVGGTCLNVGCIPSKALIHASNTYSEMSSYSTKAMGISVVNPKLDWAKTIAWKDRNVLKLTKGVEYLLKANGVKLIQGSGTLTSSNEVTISGKDTQAIRFKNIILATGSENLNLSQFPVDHKNVLDSTDLLSLKTIPKSLLVLGGGVIGLELSFVYARLGCEVTIIEMMEQLLPMYDGEAGKLVLSAFEGLKGKVITRTEATSLKTLKKGIQLSYKEKGETKKIKAEKIAITIGRIPRLEALNISENGIEIEDGKIMVNGGLQTNIPHIYAIGDIVSGPMLAHKATAEGIIAAEKISGLNVSREDIQVIPNVIYSKPEIASVGLTEEEAKNDGQEVIFGKFPFSALGRAAITGSSIGFIKYIADKKTNQVLGATVVSNNASELIAEATFAIEMGATLDDISLTVHPHPSFGEAHMEAASAGLKRAIHIKNN